MPQVSQAWFEVETARRNHHDYAEMKRVEDKQALGAAEALAKGMIWKVVPDAALMDEARTLATRLATQPTKGLASIKRLITAASANSLDSQLDLERDAQRELGRSHDAREGVRAFLGKRKPEFRGN